MKAHTSTWAILWGSTSKPGRIGIIAAFSLLVIPLTIAAMSVLGQEPGDAAFDFVCKFLNPLVMFGLICVFIWSAIADSRAHDRKVREELGL